MKKGFKVFLGLLFGVSLSSMTSASVTNGSCDALAGTWTGSADVKLFVLSCGYDATVTVPAGNPVDLNIKVKKSSGSFLCPKNIDYTINASCNNGEVLIKDNTVDITGVISDDSRSANLNGTIYVLYKRHPIKLTINKN